MRITLTDAEKTLYSDPLELCLYILGNVPDLLTDVVKDVYPEQKLKKTGMSTPTGSFYKLTKDGETELVHISNRSVTHIDPADKLNLFDFEKEALGLTIDKEESGKIYGFIGKPLLQF